MDRCKECIVTQDVQTGECPECRKIMDLILEGMTLSLKCRECQFEVATTAPYLCFQDGSKYPKECYSKLSECKYANYYKLNCI